MKYLAWSLVALAGLVGPAAIAAPDCWTTDAGETGKNRSGREIQDGAFLVTVDTAVATKEDLLLVIEKVDFGNLKADSFPQLFQGLLIISTRASVAGTDKDKVDRPKLIDQVSAQLDEISRIPGVKTVDCNGIARPKLLPAF